MENNHNQVGMMSKITTVLTGLLLVCTLVHAQKKPYFYQTVSNEDKSIDFVFGLYPATINYFEGKDFPPYTAIRGAVLNRAKGKELAWGCYVNILLKSGDLIRNYTPSSKDGPYACSYNVSSDSTHYQFFCFHAKFTDQDIDKAWLGMNDDQIFKLAYDKNDGK